MNNLTYAKWLRECADEFRRTAQSITEEHSKKSFLDLAHSYDEMAKVEEALAKQSQPNNGN